MRSEIKRELLRAIYEWREAVDQVEGRIVRAEGSAASAEGALGLLLDAMARGNLNAMSHVGGAVTLMRALE